MAINKVQYGNTTLIDLSTDTLSDASQIKQGFTGHLRNGNPVQGTLSFSTIHTGSSAPSSSTGVNGDIYLQTGS